MIDRDFRCAVWNALRTHEIADTVCYPIIEAAAAEFAKSQSAIALSLVLTANRTASDYGLPHGLADCVDNHGHPYQSASLAAALRILRDRAWTEAPEASSGPPPATPSSDPPVLPPGGGRTASAALPGAPSSTGDQT